MKTNPKFDIDIDSMVTTVVLDPTVPAAAVDSDPDELSEIDELVFWLGTQDWSEFAQSLHAQVVVKGRKLSPKQIASAKSMRTKVEARAAHKAGDEARVAEVGVYEHGGFFYRVKRSNASGRLYAQKIVASGDSGKVRYEYASGVVFKIDPEKKITAAEAAEFGMLTGNCVFCGLEITTPESRTVGYGPVCAKNNSLPWGAVV